jgi:hypothetical protein
LQEHVERAPLMGVQPLDPQELQPVSDDIGKVRKGLQRRFPGREILHVDDRLREGRILL